MSINVNVEVILVYEVSFVSNVTVCLPTLLLSVTATDINPFASIVNSVEVKAVAPPLEEELISKVTPPQIV